MKSNFFDLLQRLVKADVDFIIVGGFAGVAHGCTYVTQDVDICCSFTPANLLRLQKALSGLHPVHRMTSKRQKLKLTKTNCTIYKNLYLDTDIGQLDCLSFIDGLGDYQKLRSTCEILEVDRIKLSVLSIDALIKSKKAMALPRDKEAILQLEAIKKLKKQRS